MHSVVKVDGKRSSDVSLYLGLVEARFEVDNADLASPSRIPTLFMYYLRDHNHTTSSSILDLHFNRIVAFKVYDMDRDGFISNGELYLVLKQMVGNNLKDQQLQQIVDKTIMEADKDG